MFDPFDQRELIFGIIIAAVVATGAAQAWGMVLGYFLLGF